MRAVPLLLLLLCPPLFAAAPQSGVLDGSFAPQAARIKLAINTERKRLTPLLHELTALSATYAALDDPATAAGKREELRRTINNGLGVIEKEGQAFDDMRGRYNLQQTMLMLGKLSRRESEDSIKENFNVIFDNVQLREIMAKDFKDEIRDTLNSDEDAYKLAVKRFAAARRRKLYAGGGAAAAVLLAAGLFFFLRRRDDEEEPQPPAPLPPPAAAPAPQPAGVPQLKPPPSPEDVTGSVLEGRYRVEQLLRIGTLGPVYRAIDSFDHRPLILKTVTEDFHRTTQDVERFFARAKEYGALRHPALAEVRAVFRIDNRIYIAAEQVAGTALSALLRPGSAAELRSVKLIAGQLSELLEAAHTRNFIHGAVAPSNIILQADGSVKVLDLGICGDARRRAAKLALSREVGDPAYLAPEQELGSEFKQSDIYSLGVLCYALLTGRPPYPGPNFLAQKRERKYAPASGLSAKVPVEIDPILRRALSPEPQQRFQSGADFFSALDSVPEKAD
ncbi:MAG: serine/threonine-protein kinase [Elusimicrobiota bacterium]